MDQEELKNTRGPLVYVATRDDGMRYIGVTKHTINKRYALGSGDTYFSRAYHEAKHRFTFEVIMCDDIEDAYDLEELMVDRAVVDSPKYFNRCTGGSSTYYVSKEMQIKCSRIQRPEGCPDLIDPDGIIHSIPISVREFCSHHININHRGLSKVLTGQQFKHKGWRLAPSINKEGT